MTDKLIQIVERYFARLRDEHGLGAGTDERSYYPALAELLNGIGQELKPKVLCLSDLANTGAGHPDFGLYTANQVQKGEPRKGQPPERGVIEMKGVGDETWLTADTKQVSKYFGAYQLVIVSNLRDFVIVGEGPNGEATKLEGFRLAPNAKAFWNMVATPRKSAETVGRAFGEYIRRALTQSVALREPKDVAWFVASYARDALNRVEEAGDLPALGNVRASLEEALGVTFDAEKGEHFFRSTLVQTLFYGVFSAWVLWARETPRSSSKFEWRLATWHLTVPFIRTLFDQIASPEHLQPLRLIEVLDWTAATLNRIEDVEFFKKFNDTDAVQFFYEPFLEAFDPELRKELGVWYTPSEVVTYMVARVDKALREDLKIEEGLASEQVYILDPCCGTGAFLAAVLKRIEASYEAKGYGALKGQMVKKAALSRVFGFEIMPAPFVVSHLQIGLTLRAMGAPLDGKTERLGVFLTNALTGWEPHVTKPLPFPGLEEERSRADKVKQDAPILVVIGNPPYNGFAGVNEGTEERALTDAYKQPKKVRRPEGQGLNDLYVRFFRMAERRIVQKLTIEKKDLLSSDVQFHYEDGGQGIVCFISNYSWLDGMSFTAMRERYLEAYDAIRIDCLNGDARKTGKTTPDGKPDPSIFSTEHNREGIQVGTAIATLIRKLDHLPANSISSRQVWGAGKLKELLGSAEIDPTSLYSTVTPQFELGLPFATTATGAGYFDWPKLPDLLPLSFPGVKTSRDEFLVAIDRDQLEARLAVYFDNKVSHADMQAHSPSVMMKTNGYDALAIRDRLMKKGRPTDQPIRFAYRPFDIRWLFWEGSEGLLDRPREDMRQHVAPGNRWLSVAQHLRKGESEPQYVVATTMGSLHLIERGANLFPAFRAYTNSSEEYASLDPNLSAAAIKYLAASDVPTSTLFDHAVAILHSTAYRSASAGGLLMDWPRIPIPVDAKQLLKSASLGGELSALLDPEAPVSGVSSGKLRAALRTVGLITKSGTTSVSDSDLALTSGWGYFQVDKKTGAKKTMAGQGKIVMRDYTAAERAAMETEGKEIGLSLNDLVKLLGERTADVYLNTDTYWSNVPAKVWDYKIGGYQVFKKWLSYRERGILNRALKPDEAAYASEIVRRIAAILMMGPMLDTNYEACAANSHTYETLGLSREAIRERKEAKILKRGVSRKHTPATKQNQQAEKARGKIGSN